MSKPKSASSNTESATPVQAGGVTDVESIKGSSSAHRGASDSSVDSANARDAAVLPDQLIDEDSRNAPRSEDLDGTQGLNGPDTQNDMTAQ